MKDELNVEMVENLFMKQMMALTRKANDSFDYQFSGRWLR